MDTDRIVLAGLSFYGYHGVLEEERRLGQRFVVDLTLSLDLRPAGLSDDLAQTVDYVDVYRIAREVVEGPPHRLIESLAESIAARLLATFPSLSAVAVRVAKPGAPLPSSASGEVAVEIHRGRSPTSGGGRSSEGHPAAR